MTEARTDAALLQTPFSRHATAEEILDGVDLTGRRAIVTGASSGIGVETARALLRAGAEVTLAVRDVELATEHVASLLPASLAAAMRARPLDLSDLDSVREFVRGWDGPLDILVENAGVMAVQELRLTRQRHELQFATNHLGHFALANGLHDALAAAGSARIVSVSSSAMFQSPVVFGDIDFAFRRYDPWLAYGQSKTANVLFAVGATARWTRDGIATNALTPGSIITGLGRHVGEVNSAPPDTLKTAAQGAATSVLLAASPLLEGVSGRFFADNQEAPRVTSRPPDGVGVASYAVDPTLADLLWEASMEMLG